jgi:ribonucleoside-diphosphate reductase alpha chain
MDVQRLSERLRETGTLSDLEDVPNGLKRIFRTALEIPAEHHLRVQAAFQRHVDNAVSKTINLPQDAGTEDIADAYMRAWRLGLKGITVYRYGAKSRQVLEAGTGEERCRACTL